MVPLNRQYAKIAYAFQSYLLFIINSGEVLRRSPFFAIIEGTQHTIRPLNSTRQLQHFRSQGYAYIIIVLINNRPIIIKNINRYYKYYYEYSYYSPASPLYEPKETSLYFSHDAPSLKSAYSAWRVVPLKSAKSTRSLYLLPSVVSEWMLSLPGWLSNETR